MVGSSGLSEERKRQKECCKALFSATVARIGKQGERKATRLAPRQSAEIVSSVIRSQRDLRSRTMICKTNYFRNTFFLLAHPLG